jgi:serine-type D-Ala-D-Ala carboxypeptidase (penicillin-binding protein 5/6)
VQRGPYRLTAAGASHARIPGVEVRAGLVVDGGGRVVWMRRPHRALPVASLTKLMTVLLVPHPTARARVEVTRAMLGVPGFGIGLRRGQRLSVRQLVAAALVASANDAATALAVHRAGSVAAFVRLMNRRARRFGLRDTHYSNPSGIYDQGNRSSAWDTALLVHRVLARRALARLVATRVYPASQSLQLVNTNRLLWTYPGAIGVKTGFTTAAGRCLALAARRRGRLVVAVALDVRGAEWRAGRRLLDFGFRHWRR